MRKRCFVLLETLIVLIIILILAYLFLNHYKTNIFGEKHKKALHESGIGSSSPSALIQETKNKVDAINKKIEQRQVQVDKFFK